MMICRDDPERYERVAVLDSSSGWVSGPLAKWLRVGYAEEFVNCERVYAKAVVSAIVSGDTGGVPVSGVMVQGGQVVLVGM